MSEPKDQGAAVMNKWDELTVELARAVMACNAGDRSALHRVMAKVMVAAEEGRPRLQQSSE